MMQKSLIVLDDYQDNISNKTFFSVVLSAPVTSEKHNNGDDEKSKVMTISHIVFNGWY